VSHYFSIRSKLKAVAIPAITATSFFIVGVLIAQYMYRSQLKEQETSGTVVCSAKMTYLFENMKADVLLEFMSHLAGNSGVINLSGNFYQDNKITGTLRRKIPFTWEGTLNYVQLRSGEIKKSIIDDSTPDDLLEKVLPNFYVYSNKRIDYTISREGADAWLFLVGRSPKFICEEIPNT